MPTLITEGDAVHPLDLTIELLQLSRMARRHGSPGADPPRAQRIEHRHHSVTDELLDHAAVGLDGGAAREKYRLTMVRTSSASSLCDSTVKSTRSENRTVTSLRCSPSIRDKSGSLLAQGFQRGVDDGVAEHAALHFERGNRLVDAATSAACRVRALRRLLRPRPRAYRARPAGRIRLAQHFGHSKAWGRG